MLDQLYNWWSGGDILMPIMFLVAVILYTLLAERSVVLFGIRRQQRRDELLGIMRSEHRGQKGVHWRAFAARYVALAEELELTRGFMVIRALTASLPLLGLLGTVTGMVDTFGQLGLFGLSSTVVAQNASAGIGLALTATQYGMALAIPAVLWEWALSRRVAQLAQHREMVVREKLDHDQIKSSHESPLVSAARRNA